MLLQPQRGVTGAGEGEDVGDRLVALRVGDGVGAPFGNAQPHVLAGRDVGDETCAFDPARRAVRDAGRAGRTATPRRGWLRADRRRGSMNARRRVSAACRAAPRTRTARRPRAARRARARRRRRAAGTSSRGRRSGASRCGSPSAPRGRAGARRRAGRSPSRPGRGGPRRSRRADARPPRRGRAPTARPGSSSAAPVRSARARRGGRQRVTCSSSSSRFLYATPSSPQLPRPFADTTRCTGRNGARSQRAQNVPAARAAPG